MTKDIVLFSSIYNSINCFINYIKSRRYYRFKYFTFFRKLFMHCLTSCAIINAVVKKKVMRNKFYISKISKMYIIIDKFKLKKQRDIHIMEYFNELNRFCKYI